MSSPSRYLSILLLALGAAGASAQDMGPNVILVTLDGLRWQEAFGGVDTALVASDEYTTQRAEIDAAFAAAEPTASAAKLMPFLHDVLASKGALIGNRNAGSCARVTNPWFFSYPGYNEILTGKADPAIDSNDPEPNANVTFLEWLNREVPGYGGKVAAFGSWNVFEAIINTQRSGVPVNVGKPAAPASDMERLLARMHDDVPHLWNTVRLDVLTHYGAMDYLKRERPRVLYISYGETDDFAHDGHYDQYLFAAHRTDAFLRELWETVQGMDGYRDNTVLFVTTDHGRGSEPEETWRQHGSRDAVAGYIGGLEQYPEGIVGSEATWMAAIGPGIAARGMIANAPDCAGADQVVATLLTLMGLHHGDFAADIGAPLNVLLETAP